MQEIERKLISRHLPTNCQEDESFRRSGRPHWSSRFPRPARTHHKAPPTDPSRCYAQLPRSSMRSSYPLSTNFSHQLWINTASDPDTRLHLPPSSSQQTCCCLPTPMTLASGGSPMFPFVVHHPAFPSIWPAVQSLRRGLPPNPGVTMWCVSGCS